MPLLSSYPERVLTRVVGLDSSNRVGLAAANPSFNVQHYGATGDGTTDDSVAVQAAIDAAGEGRTVLFPHGSYYVPSGVTVSERGTLLVGTGGENGTAGLFCGSNDVTTLTLDGFASGISNLEIDGAGIGCSNPALHITGNAVESTVYNCRFGGGTQCIYCEAVDILIFFIHAENAYGDSIVKFDSGGNGYLLRCKLDQGWPGATPGVGPDLSARTNLTLYALNDLVTFGGWVIQCTQAGTSAGVSPTLQNYGVNITDGSAIWQIVAPETYYSLYLGGGGVINENGDHTGPFSVGVLLNGPQACELNSIAVGECFNNGVWITGGAAATSINGGQITNLKTNGSSGIRITTDSNDTVINNTMLIGSGSGSDTGISIESGTNTIVNGLRTIGNFNTAINVSADVEKFIITSNPLGGSATWGSNTNSVIVEAGTSDHYVIANNITSGAAAVSDGGSGVNKTITGNVA